MSAGVHEELENPSKKNWQMVSASIFGQSGVE